MSKLLIVTKVVLRRKQIMFKEQNQSLTAILWNASVFTNVPIKQIKSKSRKRQVAIARMLYLAFCYDFIKESLSDIAKEVNKTHATTIYANTNVQFTFAKEYNSFLNYMKDRGYKLININRKLLIDKYR